MRTARRQVNRWQLLFEENLLGITSIYILNLPTNRQIKTDMTSIVVCMFYWIMIIKYIIYYWFLLLYDLKNNYAELGGYYPSWPSGSEANAWQLVRKQSPPCNVRILYPNHCSVMAQRERLTHCSLIVTGHKWESTVVKKVTFKGFYLARFSSARGS